MLQDRIFLTENRQLLLCPQQQYRNADAVLDSIGGGSEEDVFDEAMPVGAHGDQVTSFFLHPFDDLGGRVAIGKFGMRRDSRGFKLGSHFVEISQVFRYLRTHGVGAIRPCRPSIGNVQQHQAAVHAGSQLFYVLDDRAIGRRSIERDQNGVIHCGTSPGWCYPPTITRHAAFSESGRPTTSMMVIRIALAHPAIRRNQPLRHFPVRRCELVKCNNGNMANGNCSAKTTWLRVSRSVTLLSPRNPMIAMAGRIAISRVISRRSHGLMRQFMKPSITTWPARVPVIVLLCPLARSAMANSVLANPVPSSGASVR